MSGLAKILNDSPIANPEEAAFGFDKYGRALASVALEATSPITIGIFGGWGTGKTSLMRLIYNELESSQYKERVFPIWFNAWRYENESHLILPLLCTIRDELDLRHPNQGQMRRFLTFLDKFVRALSYGLETDLKAGPLSIKYAGKDSLKAAEEMAKNVGLSAGLKEAPFYHDAFRYLERAIAGIEPIRLVVFVDDLDRCAPDKLLQVLESIKLMLNFPGLVFVIGVDRIMVESAVVHKYGEDSGIDGNRYVKKLVQVFFNIPAVRSDDIQIYVRKLVTGLSEASIESIARIVTVGAGSNPREIKRLVNNFSLIHRLNPEKTTPEKTALLLVLQQQWPSVYRKISERKAEFLEFGHWFQERRTCEFGGLKDEKDEFFLSSFSLGADTWGFLVASGADLAFSSVDELDEYLHFASIASYEALQPGEIEFQHTIMEELPPEEEGRHPRYRWRITPVASNWTLQRVDKIVYRLPASSYRNPKRTATAAEGFSITGVGWSNIDVRISVCLKSGQVVDYTYHLDLGARNKRRMLQADALLDADKSDDAAAVLLAAIWSFEEPARKSELIKKSDIAEDRWNAAIKTLLDEGKVIRIGKGGGTKYRIA